MIYICVLNYENAEYTLACLDSLLKLRDVEFRILLIDNASSDDSMARLSAYANEHAALVRLFSLKRNLGYAGGNNVGLKYALSQNDCDYAWVLNNDTLVEPGALKALVAYMESNPQVGICGSKLVYAWDRSRLQGYGGFYNRWIGWNSNCVREQEIEKIDYVSGAAAFVRREFLERVGLMSEDYFLYFEELDWAERARGIFRIGCEPRSVVYHWEGASIGAQHGKSGEKSILSDYYSVRNRLLFTRRYHPWCLPSVYVMLFLTIANRLRRKQWDRILVILKLMVGIKDYRFEHPRVLV